MRIKQIGTLLFACLASVILSAQNTQEMTLEQLINQLESSNQLEFSYDPELTKAIHIKQAFNLEDGYEPVLESLMQQFPIIFEELEENYWLLKTGPYRLDLTILDQLSKESIPGVYVRKNGELLQLVSDVDGKLSTTIDWKMGDIISFETLGYEPLKIPVVQLFQQENNDILLKQGTTVLNELIITSYLGDGISADQKNHSLQVQTKDLGMLPGDLDKDLLVSLKTLPGIHTVTGRSGELRVRGGTPDQTLILFNDIPIYHKGYYYGTISPFSTDIVDKVTVHRSGYSPRLGGRVGGAVEIESKGTVPESFHAGVATNSYMASSYVKAPLIKNKLGATLSFRTSHPGDYRSPKEKQFDEMVLAATEVQARSESPGVTLEQTGYEFWDLNGSLVFQPSESDVFKFNFLSINNENPIRVVQGDTLENLIRTELENLGFSGHWQKQFGTWTSKLYFTTSNYTYQLDDDQYSLNDGRPLVIQNVRNDIKNNRAGLSFRNLTTVREINAGYELTDIATELLDVSFRGRNTISNRPPPQNAQIHSVYGDYAYYGIEKLMINGGLRVNYVPEYEDFRIEPRVFANYHLSDQFTLKSSFGLYSQFLTQALFFDFSDINLQKLSWGMIRENDPRMRSWQSLIGFSYQHKNWLVDVDGYLKEVGGLFTNGPNIQTPDGFRPTVIHGSLSVKGIDLLVRYRKNNFDIWGNYTLSKADMMFADLKLDEFPANYDQRHKINISGSYNYKNFRGSLGWFASSGLPNYLNNTFFPFIGPYNQPLPEPTSVGEIERFDWVHQLDASVAYEFYPGNGRTRVTVGASALNLYNRDNLLETVNVRQRGPNEIRLFPFPVDRYNIGFAPDILLKIEF